MADRACIAANVSRLRLDRQLTQTELAARAGLSRVALGKIERGAVVPRARTITDLAEALGVPVAELVVTVRPLESVRFRARARVHDRGQILARVSKWLDAYAWLETKLNDRPALAFKAVHVSRESPAEVAREARRAARLQPDQAVRDICGLLEENGVKVLLLDTKRDSFFGLSVGPEDNGPAVVVNTWDRISVERWIFTAAHELGHLLLHPADYRRDAIEVREEEAEHEADAFASEFLMPESAFHREWQDTCGHPLLVRVLKVKRIYGVSYQAVLHRLVETGREEPQVWGEFRRQHEARLGKRLGRTDEPEALPTGKFAWSWNRSAEPAGLTEHDFVEDRLSRLVRHALDDERISLGRAAEILELSHDEIRERIREWARPG